MGDNRLIDFELSEEIIRQTVEIAFKLDKDWHIAFTNPTAGIWKKANIIANGKEQLLYAYKKEEKRPDLILQHLPSNLFLVCEAKNKLRDLTNDLDNILKKLNDECSKISARISNRELGLGFIFGSTLPTINPEIDSLNSLLSRNRDVSRYAVGYIIITVYKNEQTKNIEIVSHASMDNLRKMLPSMIFSKTNSFQKKLL